jgi:hypothetical protein
LKFDILFAIQIWGICQLTLGTFVLAVYAFAAEPPRPPATRVEVVTDRMHGVDNAEIGQMIFSAFDIRGTAPKRQK